MSRQCLLDNNGTTVLITGGPNDELTDIVQAAHNEYQWLSEKERATVFAPHQ